MNLLIFTLSLILILAAMSYARFENFTKNRFQANMWMAILKDSQRDLYNQQQKLKTVEAPKKPKGRKFTAENQTPSNDKQPQPEKPKRVDAGSGRISLGWFFDEKHTEKEAFKHIEALTKTLIENQWGKQPFYRQILKEHPDFLSQLIQTMIALGQEAKLKNQKPLKHLDDLIYLEWPDNELKAAFGRMLQDGLIYEGTSFHDDGSPEVSYSAPKGFQNLNDYFTAPFKDKIRIWLAPRPILRALFQDPAVVSAIVERRREYYKEARKGDTNKRNEIADDLAQEFASKTPYGDIIEWKVTKTLPGGTNQTGTN